ncbi:hypothetical protein [uncultured Pseudodesulfovibrio sp.]|uniref:hypothetical protein n=1 Tax=uncultured Pseudodesulfovibrio sp. TaxID=2035858 RepID=UPI0029C8D4BE|nr:hypothetical protein [uncultured Pseudodesulfovibrio sp.]
MRIRGSGSGFQGFGKGRDRSDSFRKGRKKGQKVRGILLKWISKDMAWVNIDGHKLLANLHSPAPEGTHLTFIIRQLSPEIILKAIFEPSAAKQGPLDLIKTFDTSRTLFENKFRLLANYGGNSLHGFMDWLIDTPEAFVMYSDVVSCINQINRSMDHEKNWQLLYAPWMLPEGRRHIAAIYQKNSSSTEQFTELHYECELAQLGMVRIEFLHKSPDAGYRLKTQYSARTQELKQYLKSRSYPNLTAPPECLGISRLSPREHGGLLSEIIFAQQKKPAK